MEDSVLRKKLVVFKENKITNTNPREDIIGLLPIDIQSRSLINMWLLDSIEHITIYASSLKNACGTKLEIPGGFRELWEHEGEGGKSREGPA